MIFIPNNKIEIQIFCKFLTSQNNSVFTFWYSKWDASVNFFPLFSQYACNELHFFHRKVEKSSQQWMSISTFASICLTVSALLLSAVTVALSLILFDHFQLLCEKFIYFTVTPTIFISYETNVQNTKVLEVMNTHIIANHVRSFTLLN